MLSRENPHRFPTVYLREVSWAMGLTSPIARLYEVMENAIQGIQSDSPQALTSPSTTVDFKTPTMTFGEVGTTLESFTNGKTVKEHSVGQFNDQSLLERQRLVSNTTWTTAEAAGSTLTWFDVNKYLLAEVQNTDVLQQFLFFRGDIEVTIRLNSTQFFYGALAMTLRPAGTGYRLDERLVQAPTVISAATAEAVVKEWKYSYPHAWMDYYNINAGNFPCIIELDVLAPLTASMPNMPTSIPIQIWARYKNTALAWPTQSIPASVTIPVTITGSVSVDETKQCPGKDREFDPTRKKKKQLRKIVESNKMIKKERQSTNSNVNNITITVPQGSGGGSPTKDKNGDEAKKNTIDKTWDAFKSISIGDAADAVMSLGAKSLDFIGKAAFFAVDKPDRTVPQDPIIQDYCIDSYASDIPDTNAVVALHRSRYIDPSPSRLPQGKDWTLSEYAQIPGLRSPQSNMAVCGVFVNQNDLFSFPLIQIHPNSGSMKIPLDFAYCCSTMWRGSIKVCLQFFASSFVSARFLVQYINITYAGGVTMPVLADYDNGLSRIINVKGDTIDCFTLPWLSQYDWSTTCDPQIQVTMLTEMASPDPAITPAIYMIVWVSGGEDIQFAGPRVPDYTNEWNSTGQTLEKERQACIQTIFKSSFPAIVENCSYDLDNGYCTTEQIGSLAELSKRYSPLQYVTGATSPYAGGAVHVAVQDSHFNVQTNTVLYTSYWTFRKTMYGTIRHMFLYRVGGFKYRRLTSGSEQWTVGLSSYNSNPPRTLSMKHISSNDNFVRLTIPWSAQLPFSALDYYSFGYELVPPTSATYSTVNQEWIAARDDVMFGWPILPTGLNVPSGSSGGLAREEPSWEEELEPEYRSTGKFRHLRPKGLPVLDLEESD